MTCSVLGATKVYEHHALEYSEILKHSNSWWLKMELLMSSVIVSMLRLLLSIHLELIIVLDYS